MAGWIKKGACVTLIVLMAGAAMVLAAALGNRPDPQFEQFLKGPGPIETGWRQRGADATDEAGELQPPLVKAATAFALYLNPPAKPKPVAQPAETKVAAVPEIRPATSSPKFELHGISFNRSSPADSMALVWQPDVGRRWVRQGAQLGHLVVEQVNRDGITYRDGERTHALALQLGETSTAVVRDNGVKPSPAKPDKPRPSVPSVTPVQRIEQPPVRPVARSVIVAERRRFAQIPHGETVAERERRSR